VSPGDGAPVVAVVGGGISGLTAAWRLASSGRARVLLLEASGRTGGPLQRARVGRGPVVDVGAESLLARRPEAVAVATELGLGDRLVAPATTRAAVASRGALHPMPRGTVMGVPGDPASLTGLLTPAEVARAGAERLTPPVPDDVDVAGWVAGRLGRAVVDRLVEPLLGGVYAGHSDALGLRACVPALWPAARDGSPLLAAVAASTAGSTGRGAGTAAGGPVFAGLRGGVALLAEALADALPAAGVVVRRDAPVRALARSGGAWHLALPGGEDVVADAVVLAVPSGPASTLLAGEVPAAAAELAAVPVASLALCTLLLPPGALDAVVDEEGAALSGVLVPPVEGRLVKAMTCASRKWSWVAEAAGGADVLRLSVGRHGEEGVLRRSDADLLAQATADAADLLGVRLAARAATVTRWDRALPQYGVGHLDRVARVRAAVAGQPGLAVAGATYEGVGVPACIASADRAAAQVLAVLAG
jgi:protoporphyrinogen/coproporphyrinogen III oxidase